MEKIGTEFVRRELEIVPARARVIEYYSVNYGCKNCRRNAETPNIIKVETTARLNSTCTPWKWNLTFHFRMLKNLLSYLAKNCRYDRIYMGITKTGSGSPFAKMSTF